MHRAACTNASNHEQPLLVVQGTSLFSNPVASQENGEHAAKKQPAIWMPATAQTAAQPYGFGSASSTTRGRRKATFGAYTDATPSYPEQSAAIDEQTDAVTTNASLPADTAAADSTPDTDSFQVDQSQPEASAASQQTWNDSNDIVKPAAVPKSQHATRGISLDDWHMDNGKGIDDSAAGAGAADDYGTHDAYSGNDFDWGQDAGVQNAFDWGDPGAGTNVVDAEPAEGMLFTVELLSAKHQPDKEAFEWQHTQTSRVHWNSD